VTGLPPALAPWAAQLAPFAPDLALSLGGWARRIAAALGPLSGRRAGEGEPDGVGGIARRGPYERLLLSEWLLAEELPDEFTRRAAAGEHLFVERARRERSAARRSVALLDAGPDQLGAPRIAQLAALVVLAARAEAAGAEFAWGIAQHPGGGLVGGFSADLARRLLDARTEEAPSDEVLAAWQELLPPPAERDDLWLVGGPSLLRARGADRASRLLVEDVADPDARQVRLVLGTRLSGRREVVLELPPEPDCIRLVRDPFAAAVQEPARAPRAVLPEAGILFHPGGHRIALRLRGAALLDHPVPNSPRQKVGRGRVVAGGPGVVAVGWEGKRLAVASIRGGHLVVGRSLVVDIPGGAAASPAAPGPAEPLGSCFLWPARKYRAWFVDGAGALFDTASRPLGSLRSAVAQGEAVTALLAAGPWLAYVVDARADHRLGLVVRTPSGAESRYELGEGAGRAFLAHRGERLLVATEDAAGGNWSVRAGDSPHDLGTSRWLRPPAGTEVVGLVARPFDPALVLLESDRRRFSVLGRHGIDPAHEAVGEVASAAVSPADAVLAYTTRSGAVVVYSIRQRAVLLHLLPGRAP